MPNTLDGLYTQAAEATRSGSRTFFLATRYFPPELARAAHAAYWFAGYTRGLGRHAITADQGRRDLDRWEEQVHKGLRGQLARNPVLEVFLDATEQHKIPHRFATDLIEGARMDLDRTRYQSFSELREYCHRTSGTMSVLMAHLIGYRGPAPPKGHGLHHYHFKLFALDGPLDLAPGVDKAALLAAIEGHVIAEGELIGTYQR